MELQEGLDLGGRVRELNLTVNKVVTSMTDMFFDFSHDHPSIHNDRDFKIDMARAIAMGVQEFAKKAGIEGVKCIITKGLTALGTARRGNVVRLSYEKIVEPLLDDLWETYELAGHPEDGEPIEEKRAFVRNLWMYISHEHRGRFCDTVIHELTHLPQIAQFDGRQVSRAGSIADIKKKFQLNDSAEHTELAQMRHYYNLPGEVESHANGFVAKLIHDYPRSELSDLTWMVNHLMKKFRMHTNETADEVSLRKFGKFIYKALLVHFNNPVQEIDSTD